jgi:NADH-quinone oxidoreductase subunit G
MYAMLLYRDGSSMSERIINRGKSLTITIDGKVCSGTYGQTILEIARKNDIYIPTMCYLTKVSPIASCRMCVVHVKGVDGEVLSCQEKAIDGADITTNNLQLFKYRQNIMKLYDVNHPLQCGVCDKSGECDLQNKTLEFEVTSQEFSAKDQFRKLKKWGVLSYDPALCIMCEKCVHTCNEVIGSSALYIKPGGYKSTIDIKMSRCEQCGDCISVCPVGAMASTEYKYSANAWEATQIPASCSHCSSGCALYYDVKTLRDENDQYYQEIMRVKNDFEFSSLCGAGRFGFHFANREKGKDIKAFKKAIEALKSYDAIRFNSYITNEEAYILQLLKDKLGIKLINEDARNYQKFMQGYSSITGKMLYSGDNKTIAKSDGIILIASRISRDNPGVKYHINMAVKQNRAEFIYMHPIDDEALKNKYTQFIKYEVGSEEGVLALLASYIIKNSDSKILNEFIDELDIGYLSAESNVGEEEFELILKRLKTKQSKTLLIGTDIFGHKRVKNIGRLVGFIEKYSDFKVVVIPSMTNTLGVSLICNLDKEANGKVIGYNEFGDFVMSRDGSGDFNIPALNQQEGSFVSIDKQLINTNVAVPFDGYCLNDLANEIFDELDFAQHTIQYTKKLPQDKGFRGIEFDELDNGYNKYGDDKRGYFLYNLDTQIDEKLKEVDELSAYDGTIIYRCEPLHQFNKATARSRWLKADTHLRGSASFAMAAKIEAGDKVNITFDNQTVTRMFKIDTTIKGTVALYPTFDNGLRADLISLGYRYKKVAISKVNENE